MALTSEVGKMSVTEIERVKQDIATIKEAAGLELPFGWDSVWINLIGLPCGAVWFLVFLLISDITYRYMMLVPWILLLAVTVYLRRKNTRSSRRSAIRARQCRVALYEAIPIAVAMGVFVTLAERADSDTVYLISGIVTVFALTHTLMAFHSKARLSEAGGGIPIILAGISMANWPSPDAILRNLCIAVIVGGPATAFIMMYQLQHGGTEK